MWTNTFLGCCLTSRVSIDLGMFALGALPASITMTPISQKRNFTRAFQLRPSASGAYSTVQLPS